MYIRRLSVSPETIERAIRGRLVSQHGAASRYALLPLQIRAAAGEPQGANWQLALDPAVAPPEAVVAVHAAAEQVAAEMNLNG